MTVLLLAGTREARDLAQRWRDPSWPLVASLAGATEDPLLYPCRTRIGGFGGVSGLVKWIEQNGVAAIIDATHPFATRISANAAEAANRCGVLRLALRRRPWQVRGDWIEYASLDDLASALPSHARVLLTTGRKEIAPFAARTDIVFILRTIEEITDLPDHILPIRSRPPFTLEQEIALMRRHRITHLVTKNAGGARPAKLDAAATFGLPILSIAMPEALDGPVADTVEDALQWMAKLR